MLDILEVNLKNVELLFQKKKMTYVKFSWICMVSDIAKFRTEHGFYKDNFSPKGRIEIRHHFFSWICMMLILQNLEQDMDFTKVTLVPRGLLKSDTTFVFQYDPN